MAHGRKTAFNTICAQAAASSLLPSPPMTISVSTYTFSSAPLSPANFPIFFGFPLPFSPSSLLLFRELAACSCLLIMYPVNPKVSLPFLSKQTSFHGKIQQLLFIFISYNRGKGLAPLWELAALFPPLLPSSAIRFSNITAGDTHDTQLSSKWGSFMKIDEQARLPPGPC